MAKLTALPGHAVFTDALTCPCPCGGSDAAVPQTEIMISEGKCGQGVSNEMITEEEDNARYRIHDTDGDGVGDMAAFTVAAEGKRG